MNGRNVQKGLAALVASDLQALQYTFARAFVVPPNCEEKELKIR